MKREEIEKCFDQKAKEIMLQWDLESFKQSHPTLLNAIVESHHQYKKDVLKEIKQEIPELVQQVRKGRITFTDLEHALIDKIKHS